MPDCLCWKSARIPYYLYWKNVRKPDNLHWKSVISLVFISVFKHFRFDMYLSNVANHQ